MKRIVFIVAAVLMVAASGAAFASGGVEIEAGGKLWLNTSKVEGSGFSSTSDMAMMIGPVVSAKFPNKVFAEGSIATTLVKYKYSDTNTESSRTDIDLAVGYSFVPTAGAYLGYRNISFSNGSSAGLLVGVRGSAPIKNEWSAYGDLAYLMFTDSPDGAPSESAPGIGLELGAKYDVSKTLNCSVGYKMEQTKGADSSVKSTFSGLNFTVMTMF